MKGGIKLQQISSKELMYIDDVLSLQEHMVKCLNDSASRLKDQQLKALCQNLADRCQNSFNSIARNLG
ncbi:spore coat protein [Thermoanaerobacterium sp. R66]|jgi:dsDNA-binding SOS-regulon protein|uniref:spore coat protein n=1 Tax=Thermoanaerobacterium sp. R66 TaxID=2742479 RepID=UPI000A224813|nr:spore coat protein [Thermoanaerobacterium sp. R66]MDE4543428.1 spore coat protein [Thermoanaerobacterium sp. R66]ORX22244.1 spore coat protein [Thermoanaerobacterium sp. PSU-2]